MEPKVLQEVCGGSYPPPPQKLHLFCNKEPFSLAEDKITVPRKNHGTHSSSGSAWRIPCAERMQYLHVISYDTPGRKKRWSQGRMTGRRKMGPTTIYKQVYGPAEGRASHPRTSSSNSWKSREGRKYIKKQRKVRNWYFSSWNWISNRKLKADIGFCTARRYLLGLRDLIGIRTQELGHLVVV